LTDEDVKNDVGSSPIDFNQFYNFDNKKKPTGVNHFKVYRYIKEHYHILIIGEVPYIYTKGVYLQDTSGARLRSIIMYLISGYDGRFAKSPTINQIFNLFLADIELETNIDECNQMPKCWINFKNAYWDLINEKLEPHNPSHKCLNQIPHYFYGFNEDLRGETTERYLNETYPRADDREMLLQYICYSMTADTRQQKFLIFVGKGGAGKSTINHLLHTLIGDINISNIALSELSQKFASFGLIGNLANINGDLDIDALTDTSIPKQAIGEDRLRLESKGKNAIFCRNYAKMFFLTNELPLIKNEKTNAFYRRLLVVKVENLPKNVDVELSEKLDKEVDYFIQLLLKAGHRLYMQKVITISENSQKEVSQLWRDSDTTQAFLDECCTLTGDKTDRVERGTLFSDYEDYCTKSERQKLTKNNFYKSLRVKGVKECTSCGKRYFICIKNEPDPTKNALYDFTDDEENETPFV
jgi:P4 family phage/plasmid primase-like protien